MSNVRILISQKRGAFSGVLVAHHTGSVGVRGSNPLSSTKKKALAFASAFFNEIRLTASCIALL